MGRMQGGSNTWLKEPLIRKFGQAWYDELEDVAEELKRQNII